MKILKIQLQRDEQKLVIITDDGELIIESQLQDYDDPFIDVVKNTTGIKIEDVDRIK